MPGPEQSERRRRGMRSESSRGRAWLRLAVAHARPATLQVDRCRAIRTTLSGARARRAERDLDISAPRCSSTSSSGSRPRTARTRSCSTCAASSSWTRAACGSSCWPTTRRARRAGARARARRRHRAARLRDHAHVRPSRRSSSSPARRGWSSSSTTPSTRPGRARRALGELADRMAPEQLDDARLLVSELVTNAIRHAQLTAKRRSASIVEESAGAAARRGLDPGRGFDWTRPRAPRRRGRRLGALSRRRARRPLGRRPQRSHARCGSRSIRAAGAARLSAPTSSRSPSSASRCPSSGSHRTSRSSSRTWPCRRPSRCPATWCP